MSEFSFANYSLSALESDPQGVYNLANELIPEMAWAFNYELSEVPDEQNLRGLIAHIGPAKTLQDNIGLVQERLGSTEDDVTLAANWVERSGVLLPTERSFADPSIVLPDSIETAIITGGVARWMNRRAQTLVHAMGEGLEVGQTVIAVGNRQMKETEHELVTDFARKEGRLPNEAEYATTYLEPLLKIMTEQTVKVIPVESSVGDDVLREALDSEFTVLSGEILSVGNAPAAAFTAGQIRQAARRLSPFFDDVHDQLFMIGDQIDVAREGQGPATHQNPFSALGQIARTALILHQNTEL